MSLLLLIVGGALVFYAYKMNLYLGIGATILLLLYVFYKSLPTLYVMKSRKYQADGEFEKSKEYLAKAIKIKPNDEIKMEYTYILTRLGETDEAERVLNSILSKPVNANLRGRAIIQRCLCYYKQDNLAEALDDATELYNSGYKSMNLYALLGLFKLISAPNSDETFEFCKEAYEYADDHRDICDNMVMCYYNRGEFEKAKEIADINLKNNPKFVEANFHSAQIDYKLGDYTSALEKLDNIDYCIHSHMTTVTEDEINSLRTKLNELVKEVNTDADTTC